MSGEWKSMGGSATQNGTRVLFSQDLLSFDSVSC